MWEVWGVGGPGPAAKGVAAAAASLPIEGVTSTMTSKYVIRFGMCGRYVGGER